MAALTIASVPMIVMFLFLQKYYVQEFLPVVLRFDNIKVDIIKS